MYENNDIDITGWDLRKTLRLLRKSNASLLERIQSPILYKSDSKFLTEINLLAQSQYSRKATIHHYLSMAAKFFEEIKELEQYKLKKFFYLLRSAIVCKWILEKDVMPPIEFKKMLDGLSFDQRLLKRIDELIVLKAKSSESYLHTGESEIFEFIRRCINAANLERTALPSSEGNSRDLDLFFIKTLSINDH